MRAPPFVFLKITPDGGDVVKDQANLVSIHLV